MKIIQLKYKKKNRNWNCKFKYKKLKRPIKYPIKYISDYETILLPNQGKIKMKKKEILKCI